MVTDGLWNGGAERQLALLAASLPKPWSAAVLSMTDGPYREVLLASGTPVSIVPRRFRYDPTPALRMWRLAREYRPDVVHAWGWMSRSAMVPYCRGTGTPLVDGTVRQGTAPTERGLLGRLGSAAGDAVVANSKAGLAAFGVDEGDRGHVVYNGFDPARVDSCAPGPENHFKGGNTTVIMAARMSPEKDWDLFLHAARTLADHGSWRFIAVGDGPDRQRLVTAEQDLIVRGVVEFPQGGLEVMPLVASADVGVLLTDPRHHAEGCSNAIMEYMACGLPVICSESGGNAELVEDGTTGLVVKPSSIDAVTAALSCLRESPEQAMAMGAEGRRRILTVYSPEKMAAGYVSVYEKVLGRSARSGRSDAEIGAAVDSD